MVLVLLITKITVFMNDLKLHFALVFMTRLPRPTLSRVLPRLSKRETKVRQSDLSSNHPYTGCNVIGLSSYLSWFTYNIWRIYNMA